MSVEKMDPIWALTPKERDTYLKYSKLSLPRHTSYPSPPHWKQAFSIDEFRQHVKKALPRPVSLYVHVPFCESLCRYCACNRMIQPKGAKSAENVVQFLKGLKREVDKTLEGLGPIQVAQLHLGGGTPTYLLPDELEELIEIFSPHIEWQNDAERSIELDPRVTSSEHLQALSAMGFNRVSLGVQDFNADVQKAIHRIQPYEMVRDFVAECRTLGFSSINFDLIYGLPLQTLQTVEETITRSIALQPDRIAFYRLALIPEVFRWQRTFQAHEVPDGSDILDMFLNAIKLFSTSGYEYIGLDHFAKPGEGLYQALQDRTLRRSFQGMTTGAELPVIGFGPSSISSLPHAFAQRPLDWGEWRQQKSQELHDFPKAVLCNDDDMRRAWLIEQLYCFREIDKASFEQKFNQDFSGYFASSEKARRELQEDGLLVETADKITLTRIGTLLTRVVASIFDAYVPSDAYKRGVPANQASRVG